MRLTWNFNSAFFYSLGGDQVYSFSKLFRGLRGLTENTWATHREQKSFRVEPIPLPPGTVGDPSLEPLLHLLGVTLGCGGDFSFF